MLVRFGMTNQEADLFLLLTRIKKGGRDWLTGSDIAKAIGKDRVRTYQLLHRLLQIGIVQSNYASRPKMYSVVAPAVALRRLMSIHEAKLTQLSHFEQNATEALLNISPLNIESSKQQHDEPSDSSNIIANVILLHGLPNIQMQLKKVLSGEKEACLMINDESRNHILATLRLIRPVPNSIKILVSSNKSMKLGLGDIKKRFNCDIVSIPIHLPTVIITSDQYVLLFYSVTKYRKGCCL